LDKHTAYYNLLEALPEPGCVVCRLGRAVEVKYIKDVLYSKTTAIETRAEWRDARGLCLPHARQLDQIGHALGVSLFYQDILLTLRDLLQAPSRQQAVGRRGKKMLLKALSPQIECPACAYRASLEAVYIEVWLDHILEPAFLEAVRTAAPLCLAHLQEAILKVADSERFETLREAQVAHWEALIAELGEFVRKNDYRFQHEPVGREGSAWLRAVKAIAGQTWPDRT
jgi:hypothetical protein